MHTTARVSKALSFCLKPKVLYMSIRKEVFLTYPQNSRQGALVLDTAVGFCLNFTSPAQLGDKGFFPGILKGFALIFLSYKVRESRKARAGSSPQLHPPVCCKVRCAQRIRMHPKAAALIKPVLQD